MKNIVRTKVGCFISLSILGFLPPRQHTQSQEPTNSDVSLPSSRLAVSPFPSTKTNSNPSPETAFQIPKPAHAFTSSPESPATFKVSPSKGSQPAPSPEVGKATYLLPEPDKKKELTPDLCNLNLPSEVQYIDENTKEEVILPAGTYRQILHFPIDSPLLNKTTEKRITQGSTATSGEKPSRYAEPVHSPIWVRYESLEKIKIGEATRRGGIDLPAFGPEGLKPRLWYAKSEDADVWSSLFYFVFGGAGYTVANLAGWSAGNTREIPQDFPYRLIRK